MDIRHDPLRYAIRWARAVLWQAQRLIDSRLPPPSRDGDRPGFFDRIAIEQHFLLVAAAQLDRALRTYDPERRLPADLRDKLAILRNVREHWDEWEDDKRSQRQYRERWPEQSPYTVSFVDGDREIVLGQIVKLSEFVPLVRALLQQLESERSEQNPEEVAHPGDISSDP